MREPPDEGFGIFEGQMMEEGKQRGFWRPRFSLWAMLVLITVVAIPLSYVAQRRAWNLKRKAVYEAMLAKGVQTNEIGLEDPTLAPTGIRKWWLDLMQENSSPSLTDIWYEGGLTDAETRLPLTDADLQELAYFPELQLIELTQASDCTDLGLSEIARLPGLIELRLTSMPKVTGSFLKRFPQVNSLSTLRLEGMDELQGEMFETLGSFKKLVALEIRGNLRLTDASLKHAHLPPSLETLDLASEHMFDETLKRWLGETMLGRLEIDANVSSAIAPALARQKNLLMLRIVNAPLVDDDFAFIAECPRLQDLTLSAMPIHGDFLRGLSVNSSLESVDFSQTLVTDTNLGELAGHPNLHDLLLALTPVSGDFVKAKPKWPKLHTIDLRGTRFSETGKVALKNLFVNFSRVMLPENWVLQDFSGVPIQEDRMSGIIVPAQLAGFAVTKGMSWHSIEAQRWRMDRCPIERMAPVARLLQLAREPIKE